MNVRSGKSVSGFLAVSPLVAGNICTCADAAHLHSGRKKETDRQRERQPRV